MDTQSTEKSIGFPLSKLLLFYVKHKRDMYKNGVRYVSPMNEFILLHSWLRPIVNDLTNDDRSLPLHLTNMTVISIAQWCKLSHRTIWNELARIELENL